MWEQRLLGHSAHRQGMRGEGEPRGLSQLGAGGCGWPLPAVGGPWRGWSWQPGCPSVGGLLPCMSNSGITADRDSGGWLRDLSQTCWVWQSRGRPVFPVSPRHAEGWGLQAGLRVGRGRGGASVLPWVGDGSTGWHISPWAATRDAAGGCCEPGLSVGWSPHTPIVSVVITSGILVGTCLSRLFRTCSRP